MKLRALIAGVAVMPLLAACATATTSATQGGDITVSPQNTVFLVGADRISIALTNGRTPILDATASVEVPGKTGVTTVPLEFVGHEYTKIPVYVGIANFQKTGDVLLTVRATYKDGSRHSGIAHVTVSTKSSELPVGYAVPAIEQPVSATVNGDLSKIDTGVPGPDEWHSETVKQGLEEHKPMLLYFGTPGRCMSQTCGPTLKILQELHAAFGTKLLFEHIEPDYPAQSNILNPAYATFGLTTEPWVYFVNSDGVVADRFEGPVVLDELQKAAAGTLAGHVPAVVLGT